MSSITFESVTVKYGKQTAVAAFSTTVKSGEWLGIIGPNGAGKSSLLKAAVGINDYRGEITVDGAPLRTKSRQQRAGLVAYVPQTPVLPEAMTGYEYVLLGRSPFVTYFGTESTRDRAQVDGLLDRLEIATFARRPLSELSGGERQRFVLARALATEAPVLLLDEPTSALDIGNQQQALGLVDDLRRDHDLTVIAAMHDLTLAGLYSDRLALLDQGTVVVDGAPAAVLRAEILAEFYGARVDVRHEPDGTVIIIPRR